MFANRTQPPSVEFLSVTAGYMRDKPVFTNLELQFPNQGLWYLKGNNGTGKTTLVEIIAGYLHPFSGQVKILGEDAAKALDQRSIVRAREALHPHLSFLEHLFLAAEASGGSLEDLKGRAEQLSASQWFDYPVKELSTGTKKKLWLLFCTPVFRPVVVLDEPFDGLDSASVETVKKWLQSWSDSGLVIYSSHHEEERLSLSGRIDLNELQRGIQS